MYSTWAYFQMLRHRFMCNYNKHPCWQLFQGEWGTWWHISHYLHFVLCYQILKSIISNFINRSNTNSVFGTQYKTVAHFLERILWLGKLLTRCYRSHMSTVYLAQCKTKTVWKMMISINIAGYFDHGLCNAWLCCSFNKDTYRELTGRLLTDR